MARDKTETKLVLYLPKDLRAKVDGKRSEGYTANGFIRSLIEREFNQPAARRGQKGR